MHFPDEALMEAPLHPFFVHLPIALTALMPLLTLGILVSVARGWLPARNYVLVFAGQLAMVASGFLALRTGEADEERVERLVAHAAIESHEDAAKLFVWAAGLVLAVAIVPLLPIVHRHPRRLRWAGATVLVGTIAVLALGWRVGASGGALVYEHGAAAAFAPALQAQPLDRGPVRDDH